MKRGEVWLVALDPTVGTEIQKTRPCLIVSPDQLNGALRRIMIAPLTTRSHPAPFRIRAHFQRKDGLVLLDQIRTIDKRRAISRLGMLDKTTLRLTLQVLGSLFDE